MRDGRRILDADAHVVEPGNLFGAARLEGIEPIYIPPTTPGIPCGDFDLVADQMENGFDAPSYLRAMDAQGIDAVVLYPSVGLFVPFQPELSASQSREACRAYNDWLAEYCATDPARLAGAGIVPLIDPDAAAQEVIRCAREGLIGVFVRPNQMYGRNLGDRAYDVLYDALEETGLVLAVHEGLGLRGSPGTSEGSGDASNGSTDAGRTSTIGSDRFSSFALRHLCSHPLEQMAAMGSLMLEGALERHPSMRVAFLESGTGWLPYWLARLDDHWAWMIETETRDLTLKPSEYFARQCVISTDPEDKVAAWAISQVGADHVMWASDFPHPDAAFPDAVGAFFEETSELETLSITAADLDAIFWNTPARFYRVEDRFTG